MRKESRKPENNDNKEKGGRDMKMTFFLLVLAGIVFTAAPAVVAAEDACDTRQIAASS